jgi:thiol-disulfide isomerase/thioredoxin
VVACGSPEQFRNYSLPAVYAPSAPEGARAFEPVPLSQEDSVLLAGGLRLVRAERARPVGDFLFWDLDGREHSPATLRGRVALVVLWSTWCATCRADFPLLQDLQVRFGQAGLSVLAICRDSRHKDFVQAAAKEWITFTTIDAGEDDAFPFPYGAFPTTVVLDRRGRVRAYWQGHREAAAIEGLLRSLLAENGGEPVALANLAEEEGVRRSESEPVVSALLELPAETFTAGELFEGRIVLDVAPGWHVIAQGEGALPLEVAAEPSAELPAVLALCPAGQAVRFAGVARAVHSGRIEVPLWGLVADDATAGPAELQVVVSYQACDSTRCLLPVNIVLSGELWVADAKRSGS